MVTFIAFSAYTMMGSKICAISVIALQQQQQEGKQSIGCRGGKREDEEEEEQQQCTQQCQCQKSSPWPQSPAAGTSAKSSSPADGADKESLPTLLFFHPILSTPSPSLFFFFLSFSLSPYYLFRSFVFSFSAHHPLSLLCEQEAHLIRKLKPNANKF